MTLWYRSQHACKTLLGNNLYHMREYGLRIAFTPVRKSNAANHLSGVEIMHPLRFVTAALAATTVLAACSGDSSGPSVAGRQVAFQLATKPSTAAPSQAALVGQEIIAAGSDTIVLTSVQIVLREIELKRVGGSVCDSAQGHDECEEIEFGPTLLDLPLGTGGAERQLTVAIDTGSYGKIEFEVHPPESGDSTDSAFIALNPAFDGISIRVVGTYNGTAFTYTSDLGVEQEYSFIPPLTVTETAGTSVTLFADLNSWFLNQTADGLIDPASANKGGALEGEVKSNIEASLNAFEDDDHDGEDDHGTGS
jgi:hypothetical protein